MRRFLWDLNVDIGSRDAVAAGFFELQVNGKPQRIDPPADRVDIDPGINERGQSHVAADAAETVEMGHFHISHLLGGIIAKDYPFSGQRVRARRRLAAKRIYVLDSRQRLARTPSVLGSLS